MSAELLHRLRFCRDFHGMTGYPENSKLFGEAAECIASRDAEVAALTALNADMLAALEQLYTAANLIAYQGMMPMSQGGFIDASKGLAPALMNAYAAIAKAKEGAEP
jgi:hypothetical protein